MKKDRKHNQSKQARNRNIDITTDESGLHVQHRPKGAEKMDTSFSGGSPDEVGNSSRYDNSSDNEKEESRS